MSVSNEDEDVDIVSKKLKQVGTQDIAMNGNDNASSNGENDNSGSSNPDTSRIKEKSRDYKSRSHSKYKSNHKENSNKDSIKQRSKSHKIRTSHHMVEASANRKRRGPEIASSVRTGKRHGLKDRCYPHDLYLTGTPSDKRRVDEANPLLFKPLMNFIDQHCKTLKHWRLIKADVIFRAKLYFLNEIQQEKAVRRDQLNMGFMLRLVTFEDVQKGGAPIEAMCARCFYKAIAPDIPSYQMTKMNLTFNARLKTQLDCMATMMKMLLNDNMEMKSKLDMLLDGMPQMNSFAQQSLVCPKYVPMGTADPVGPITKDQADLINQKHKSIFQGRIQGGFFAALEDMTDEEYMLDRLGGESKPSAPRLTSPAGMRYAYFVFFFFFFHFVVRVG